MPVNERNLTAARLKWARNTLNKYADEKMKNIIAHLEESTDEIWVFEEARESLRALGKSDNEIEKIFTALQLLKSHEEVSYPP